MFLLLGGGAYSILFFLTLLHHIRTYNYLLCILGSLKTYFLHTGPQTPCWKNLDLPAVTGTVTLHFPNPAEHCCVIVTGTGMGTPQRNKLTLAVWVAGRPFRSHLFLVKMSQLTMSRKCDIWRFKKSESHISFLFTKYHIFLPLKLRTISFLR